MLIPIIPTAVKGVNWQYVNVGTTESVCVGNLPGSCGHVCLGKLRDDRDYWSWRL